MPEDTTLSVHDQVVQSSAPQMNSRANEPENLKKFREGYEKRADNFREVIGFCLDEATNDQQRRELFELLCETSKEFMQKRQAITGYSQCPRDYYECPDGSCVPKGQGCDSD